METKKGNDSIASFMGWTIEPNGRYSKTEKYGDKLQNERGIDVKTLDYHSDWNLLMKVVEKIEGLDMSDYHYKWEEDDKTRSNFCGFEFDIHRNRCSIWCNLELDPPETVAGNYNKPQSSKIKAVWVAIVEFIEYYNKRINNENIIE